MTLCNVTKFISLRDKCEVNNYATICNNKLSIQSMAVLEESIIITQNSINNSIESLNSLSIKNH